jgi:hypothetical protein
MIEVNIDLPKDMLHHDVVLEVLVCYPAGVTS